MTPQPDVIVVGAGIAGLGVAWRCAQRGLAVTICDDAPGRGASHVAAGMIAPVSEAAYGEELTLSLTLESARRWPAFADELQAASGVSIGARDEGTLAVALDADDNRVLEDLYRFQRSLELPVERLTGAEVRDLEPGVSPRARGGVLIGAERQIENRATTRAVMTACERAGVAFDRRAVEAIVVEGERARGARVDGETLPAGTIVLAAGAWSARVAGLPADVVPPVRPVKGQILRMRTRDGAPFLARSVWGRVGGRDVYLVPRADGEVVIGATVEEQGFDTTVTAEAIRTLLDDAFAVAPGADDLTFDEASAGLRPGTPDNAPILGPTRIEGLFMATGHYRNGFQLLPVTAEEVAAVVAGDPVPAVIAPFTPSRFSHSTLTGGAMRA